jgi:hypothetical protein
VLTIGILKLYYTFDSINNSTKMKIAQRVRDNKTNELGYIFHVNNLDASRVYIARFKGAGGGYVARRCKGSDLTVINKQTGVVCQTIG